ncbi:MAG: threonylcarbamoyl-AMP synthase, partial [Nostocoides sp.]
ELDHAVDAVIDTGECGSAPTTVVDFSSGTPEVLRIGAGDPARFA